MCWCILSGTCQVGTSLLVSRTLDCKDLSTGARDKEVAQWLSRLGHVLGSMSKKGELTGLLW